MYKCLAVPSVWYLCAQDLPSLTPTLFLGSPCCPVSPPTQMSSLSLT